MSMLSQAELDSLRTEFNDLFFPDTMVVMRSSSTTPDEYGNVTPVFAAAGTIACRFDPFAKQSDFAVFGAERESARSWWVVTAHWDADVEETDNLVFASETYEIIRMHKSHSLRLTKRMLAALIPGEAP